MRHLATLCSLLLSLAGAAWAASPPAPEPPAPDSNPHRGGAVDRDGNRISDGLQGTLDRARPGDTLRVVVTFQGPGSAESARRAVGPFELHREFRIINGFAATMTAAQVRALAQHPGVFRIEEDLPVSVKLDAARADFGADAARTAFGVSGAGIKACIVDTGIDPNHEQLNERLAGFYDAINGRTSAYDDHGHGTHVASIAFGDGNGGSSAARWRGVAPAVSVYGAKVLDASGSGTESGVIAGIEWCVDRGVHIISMSLGTSAASDGKDALSQAANAAAANAAVIVAAGNSGDQDRTVGSPGAAELAITVGACAEHSAPAGSSNHSDGVYLTPFSSRGPTLDNRTKPDLCAPGHSITAARSGSVNGYVAYSGTSMATPFVAGVVALGLEAQAMSPATVKQRLEATAQDRGPAGKDNDHGAGLLDAHAFVAQAKGLSSYAPTAYPAYQRVLGQVATHGLWRHTFSLAAADLGVPIGAVLTIAGQPKCTMSYFGICFAMQWDPDLDARLIDPNGTLLADSNCLADDECGLIGRQETLHAMPTVAGTYTIEVFPAADSGNNGKGGSFALDLSTGPLGGGSGGGGGDGDGGSTPTAHLYQMSGTPVVNKSNWQASVTITLHGSDHNLLQLPATVSGMWSGGYTGTGSCDAMTTPGQCTVTSGNIPKRKTSATFTVTNVSGSLTYQASANHVPNSITVNKP